MKKFTIIWDFDGTLLPIDPFDSEQALLLARISQPENPFGRLVKAYARAIIYADQHQRLRRTFKVSYIRLLRGMRSAALSAVCRDLAAKISAADRDVLWRLKEAGYDMMVLSCGTADLSERVLNVAGLSGCFSVIEGNRFRFDADRIAGMDLRLPNPKDKLIMVKNRNLAPEQTIVVGDGYTDRPLLKWSAVPIIIDRSGKRKKGFISNNFYFISSIPEITDIIEENATSPGEP